MIPIVLAIMMISGCGSVKRNEQAFVYDKAEFPGAKPWTSENFNNNPKNFQFAIIGDRGGGANPKGTFERAIEQLNWLQPEFVMSVGDYVEGYTSKPEVMKAQWDEFDNIVAKLQIPFFFVRGNHDINTPITRQAWTEGRGPNYYHFKYKDVLFIALDTEGAEESVAPELEADLATYNDLNINDPTTAKAFAVKVDLLSRVQEIVVGNRPRSISQNNRSSGSRRSSPRTKTCDGRLCSFTSQSGTIPRRASRRWTRRSRVATTPSSLDTRTTTTTIS